MGHLGLILLLARTALGGDVLVLELAGAPEAQASEQRFVEELSLALDELSVAPRPLDAPGFVRAPLTAQVARVRPLLGDGRSVAVAWLDQLGPSQLGLAVVFVTDDRAVVRLVQAEVTGPGEAEAELALAAREILWSALGPPPAELAVAPPAPSAEPAPVVASTDPRLLGARVTAVGEVALLGAEGPGPRFGLEAALDLFVQDRLGVGLGVAGATSALGEVEGTEVRVSRITPALRAQLWTLPLAPFAQVGVPFTWLQVPGDVAVMVTPRVSVGVTGHWGSLMVEGRVGYLFFRDVLELYSTGNLVYDSGRVEVGLSVGWRGPS